MRAIQALAQFAVRARAGSPQEIAPALQAAMTSIEKNTKKRSSTNQVGMNKGEAQSFFYPSDSPAMSDSCGNSLCGTPLTAQTKPFSPSSEVFSMEFHNLPKQHEHKMTSVAISIDTQVPSARYLQIVTFAYFYLDIASCLVVSLSSPSSPCSSLSSMLTPSHSGLSLSPSPRSLEVSEARVPPPSSNACPPYSAESRRL